jgi:hypothetical protein
MWERICDLFRDPKELGLVAILTVFELLFLGNLNLGALVILFFVNLAIVRLVFHFLR